MSRYYGLGDGTTAAPAPPPAAPQGITVPSAIPGLPPLTMPAPITIPRPAPPPPPPPKPTLSLGEKIGLAGTAIYLGYRGYKLWKGRAH